MKFFKFSILLLCLCACHPNPSVANIESKGELSASGNDGLNGGNFEAQEAARFSGELLSLVKQDQTIYPELDVKMLESAISKTKLFMVPKVFVRGQETDASNNGIDEIRVSLTHWQVQDIKLKKIALLFHEYLGIMGLETNTYGISNRILNPIYSMTADVRYSCDDRYNAAITVHYYAISDLYYFKFDGVDVAASKARYGSDAYVDAASAGSVWKSENCNKLELVGRKKGDQFERLGACETGYRTYDQMQFLDRQGIYFSQSNGPHSLTCYPIR